MARSTCSNRHPGKPITRGTADSSRYRYRGKRAIAPKRGRTRGLSSGNVHETSSTARPALQDARFAVDDDHRLHHDDEPSCFTGAMLSNDRELGYTEFPH